MKYTDIQLTRTAYNNSAVNKGGAFNPPLGVMRNFGFDPQTITDAQLDRIFSTYASSAFDDIDAFNPDRPLPRLIWGDLSTTIHNTLSNALILQINELLKNGLAERTETSTASTGSFTANTTPNTKIVSPDQLSQDVEDELDKIQYKAWKVAYNENGVLTVFIDDIDAIVPKTKNLIALSALTFKQLDNADLDFIGEKYAIKLIQSEISSALSFRGTWNAANVTDYENIDTIFTNTGLPLTDGTTTLTTSNTNKGDVILITITGDASFRPEEGVYDGTKWVIVTNNNEEDKEIAEINAELNKKFFVKTTGDASIKEMDATNDDNKAPSVQVMKAADKVIDDKAEQNKTDIADNAAGIQAEKTRNNEQQGQIDLNTEGRILWENESADYVRFGDVAGAVLIQLNSLPITNNNGVLNIDTTGASFAGLKTGVVVSMKLIPIAFSPRKDPVFIRDSYNDQTEIPNVILGQVDIQVKIEQDLTTITGLNETNRNILVNNYIAILVEQLPANVAGKDDVARALAKQAQADATAANNNANKRVKKQLNQNTDFTTFAELQNLLLDDDLVALTLSSGIKLSGRVVDKGTPLAIAGWKVENQNFLTGIFKLDAGFAVTVKLNNNRKKIVTKGEYRAFPINETPDNDIWENANITNGFTLVQGTSEGTTSGDIKAHTHSFNYAEQSHFLVTGGNFVETTSLNAAEKIKNINSTGGTNNLAAGINVKWYIAKTNVYAIVELSNN